MFNIVNYQENANQNHNEISPHTCQNGYYQKDKKEQMLERMWRTVLLVELQISKAAMENGMEAAQKSKIGMIKI